MSQQTSFSIEDANLFLSEQQELLEVLRQEWSRVLNQWSNLKVTWSDEQFDRFEPLFEKFVANYQDVEKESEKYIAFMQEQIRIAEERKSKLGSLPSI
jgi:hypothetical protein